MKKKRAKAILRHSHLHESPFRKRIRILLADDHTMVREGFRVLLEKEADLVVIGEAQSSEETIRLANTLMPDIILLDVTMPDFNGLQAAHAILNRHPEMKIIILSMSSNDEFIRYAVQIGIRGYVLKENASQEVINAVREVALRNHPYYAPAIQDKFLEFHKQSAVKSENKELSPRETEVLQMIAEGKTNKRIAEVLRISVKTVERHRQRVMEKLGIHDAVGLAHYAIKNGMILV